MYLFGRLIAPLMLLVLHTHSRTILDKRCDGRSRSPSLRLPPSCPQTCLITSFVRHQGGCRCRVLLEEKGKQIRNLPGSSCPPLGPLAYPIHFFQRRIAKLHTSYSSFQIP